MLPVDSCDFHLYQHAENEILPKDYGFVFKSGKKTYNDKFFLLSIQLFWCTEVNNFVVFLMIANRYLPGCKSYAVKVKVKNEDIFYIGKERVAKFYERWCSVEVNGVKGWACVEWHYNNVRNCHKK